MKNPEPNTTSRGSCPPHVAIVYDSSINQEPAPDGHDPNSEVFPPDTVSAVQSLLIQRGVSHVTILSSSQIASMALAGANTVFDAIVNLGSGLTPRFRYGQTPMFLEILGVPYSGNDPFAMLLCRDKQRTKDIASSLGLPIPRGLFIDRFTRDLIADIDSGLYPVFIKPNFLGNSLGIEHNVANDADEAQILADRLLSCYPEGLVLEQFIPGIEATVLAFGEWPDLHMIALSMADLSGASLPPSYFRDHQGKLATEAIQSAKWFLLEDYADSGAVERCKQYTGRFASALRLRDFIRVDYRIRPTGEVVFIECNAQPEVGLEASYVRSANELCFHDDFGIQKLFVDTVLARLSQLFQARTGTLDVAKAQSRRTDQRD